MNPSGDEAGEMKWIEEFMEGLSTDLSTVAGFLA